MKQGKSKDTPWKQAGFSDILSMQFDRIRDSKKYGNAKINKYYHFDLNCGSGINYLNEEKTSWEDGSPVKFAKISSCAEYRGMLNISAHFVDKSKDAISTLRSRQSIMDIAGSCYVADNTDFLDEIPGLIYSRGDNPLYAVGTVLIDPNGFSDSPYMDLVKFTSFCPRIDIILHWNSLSQKRAQHFGELTRLKRELNKRFGIVREPFSVWQWTTLFLSNVSIPIKRMEVSGFKSVKSVGGKFFIKKVDFKNDSSIFYKQQQLPFGG